MQPLWETERLYQTAFRRAYGAAKSICMNRQLAEDAVSEALIRLIRLEQRGKLRPQAEALFLKITVNEAKRIVGKRKIEYEYQPYLDARYDTSAPERETALDLMKKLEALSAKLAIPLKLHYYAGFTHLEIAQMLGIRVDAVKQRISRGRAKLRETYAQEVTADECE